MLNRIRQLAAKVEAVSGTAISLAAADAKLLVMDPVVNHDIEMFPRNPVLGSFTKIGKLAGKRPAGINFSFLFQGSGTATTAPEWSKLVKSMAFSENTLKQVTIGAVTNGPFLHGETVTAAGGGTGIVIKNTADGTTTLYFVLLTGTIGAEGLTGGTSGATATSSTASSNVGIVWLPVFSNINTLTIGSYEDGVRKLLKGCRGKGKINLKSGEPAIFSAEFMGVEAGITDTSLLTIAYGTLPVPPVLLSAAFTIGGDSLKISELEIGIENTLSPVDDISDSRGLHSYRITDRQFIGSFDPLMELVATHDFYSKWFNNTTGELSAVLGSSSGNKYEFYAPKAQYDKIEDTSRDGNQVARTGFVLNGNENIQNDEFCFFQL